MAVIQTAELRQGYSRPKDERESSGFLSLLVVYYGFMPFADVLSGALATYREIGWFSIAYKAGSLLIALLFILSGKVRTSYAAVSAIVITLLILGAGIRQSLGLGYLSDDLIYIARGPILLSLILIVLLSLDRESVLKIATIYFVATWTATTFSIIGTNWLGISLTTYDAGYGARGFYQAANEVTLGFVLSWWYLQVRVVKSTFQSLLLLAISVYLIYTIGTKSGFVVMPILAVWYLVRLMKLGRKQSLSLFIFISSIVTAYAGSIFLAVLPFLPAANASEFFINTYGVETTLTGGRFVDIDYIYRHFQNFSVAEILFGTGFNNFWFAIDGNSVESDLIDTLGGGGIIFAGWFYGILIWGYLRSGYTLPSGARRDGAWTFVFISVIMYSIFVGHVAFAATPLICVGVFVALAYKEGGREGRIDPIVVQQRYRANAR